MTKKSKPTINDIAQELGVSKTTISRAISGKGRIGAETRAKVMEYIEERNYRPNAAAKSLADSRSYNLALLLQPDSAIAQQTIRNLWKEALRQNYNILLFYTCAEGTAALLKAAENRKIDGVILTAKDDALESLLNQRQIPFSAMNNDRDFLALIRHIQPSPLLYIITHNRQKTMVYRF